MRAAVVERIGEAPARARSSDRGRRTGGALVAVRHATLNPDRDPDRGRARGRRTEVPYVPGMEGVGRLVSGERPEAGSAVRFECRLPGRGSDGSLAELALAEPDSVVELPDGVDEQLAAAVGGSITAALASTRPSRSRARRSSCSGRAAASAGSPSSSPGTATPHGWWRSPRSRVRPGQRARSGPTRWSSWRRRPTAARTTPSSPSGCARPPVGRSTSSSTRSGALRGGGGDGPRRWRPLRQRRPGRRGRHAAAAALRNRRAR